jgi:hypothetical protein
MRHIFLFLLTFTMISCGGIKTNDGQDNDYDRRWFNDTSNYDDLDAHRDYDMDDDSGDMDADGLIDVDDNLLNDDSEQSDENIDNDDSGIPDDSEIPDIAEDPCGNSVLDEGEFCDGNFINCTEIDPEKYIGGKAKCLDDCSGWETGWCDLAELNECKNGERKCEGQSSYVQCGNYDSDVYTEWSEPIDCDEDKICENGDCKCESHFETKCEGRFSYWYDSCGQKEELNKDCGKSSYAGDTYCKNGHVYVMYATRECYDLTGKCTENVKETIVAHCYDLGCTDGECNDGY